ncbi:hypothetical protein J6590_010941 [Homalodisca vitripennis]|nr:hypothetical protein J6590_010941 [Homalodisca vitripennis]
MVQYKVSGSDKCVKVTYRVAISNSDSKTDVLGHLRQKVLVPATILSRATKGHARAIAVTFYRPQLSCRYLYQLADTSDNTTTQKSIKPTFTTIATLCLENSVVPPCLEIVSLMSKRCKCFVLSFFRRRFSLDLFRRHDSRFRESSLRQCKIPNAAIKGRIRKFRQSGFEVFPVSRFKFPETILTLPPAIRAGFRLCANGGERRSSLERLNAHHG